MTGVGRRVVTDRTHRLEIASLVVLLAVVGLRPLISESYDLAGPEITSALSGVSDPLPIATLLIDVAILLAAVLWGLARGLGSGRAYRWTGLEPGLLLVFAGVVASCAVASNRRVAINASVDWLAMAVLGIVLAQLLSDGRRLRLAICVIVASGAAQAYQCFEQVLVSFPETEAMYREHREDLWKAQGVALDAPQVELFERRMQAREASGYLSHSNIAAAHLLLGFFAALGLAVTRFGAGTSVAARASGIAVLLVAGGILIAMVLTHSVGAASACGAGVAFGLACSLARDWIDRRRWIALVLGWTAFVVGAAAVAGYGLGRGTLPGPSLSFRWGYWTASAEMIRDHPWTGVGRENFGYAYLRYKSISWPEEVKNPHNFLVTAATEWGLPGLAGVLAMLVGGSVALLRPRPGLRGVLVAETERQDSNAPPMRWMVPLALAIFGPRLFLLGSDDRSYLYVATALPAIIWMLAFAVCAVNGGRLGDAVDRGRRGVSLLLNAGLFAFLLQDTINFATIVPGTATTLFALVGAAIAARRVRSDEPPNDRVPRSPPLRWVPAAAPAALLILLLGFVLPPVWRAGHSVREARAAAIAPLSGAVESHPAMKLYQRACEADRLDPAPAVEWANWLRRAAAQDANPRPVLAAAMNALDEATARNPLDFSLHGRQAMTAFALARGTDGADERTRLIEKAISAAHRAVELYPMRPLAYVDLAACQRYFGETQMRSDWMGMALAGYQRALILDEMRPDWETIRRLRPSQVAEIQANIAAVEAWLTAQRRGSEPESAAPKPGSR